MILLDSLSLQPKTEHLGVLCGNMGNIGLRDANRLYVKPDAKLDYGETSKLEEYVHIAVNDLYIGNLPAGVTKRACDVSHRQSRHQIGAPLNLGRTDFLPYPTPLWMLRSTFPYMPPNIGTLFAC